MEETESPKVKVCQGERLQIFPSCSWLSYSTQQTVNACWIERHRIEKDLFQFLLCPDVSPDLVKIKFRRDAPVNAPTRDTHTITGHFFRSKAKLLSYYTQTGEVKRLWKWLSVPNRCWCEWGILMSRSEVRTWLKIKKMATGGGKSS